MDYKSVRRSFPTRMFTAADAAGDSSSTHLLLRLLVLWDLDLVLSLSKELSLLAGLDTLGLGEESVVDGLGNGNRGNVDLGRSSDNVCLVNSSEGNTVEPK